MSKKKNEYGCVAMGICPSDYICLMDDFPGLDVKTVAKEFSHQGGGPVATAMCALSKWKVETAILTVTGDDCDSQFVIDELIRYGVDTRFMKIKKGRGAPRAFVWVESRTGKRTCVLDETTTPITKPADYRNSELPPTRVFHTDGRYPDAVLKAMRHYRKNGAQVVMDAGSPRPRMNEQVSLTDHLVASANFINWFLGPNEKVEEAIDRLLGMGPSVVVITLGEDGCIGKERGGDFFRIIGHRRKNFIVDTNGAGDIFHAGYIYGLLKDMSPRECCGFANAAAFLKCGAPGGRAGIPKLREVLNMI